MMRFSCAVVIAVICAAPFSWGQAIDLKATVIVAPAEDAQLAAQVLREEVAKRTELDWTEADTAPDNGAHVILAVDADAAPGAEGYAIVTEDEAIRITGADRRGLLFGVGHLLRNLDWAEGAASLSVPINVETAPKYPLRGHQLGYRYRANSWDAWTVEEFDQHIRELALFGTNAIENIPFQDDRESPHFKVTRREMNRAMSEICERYDLEYWVWTPAEFDLNDTEQREDLLRLHEELFTDAPRLDAVFFPGGDPGNNHPRDVIPFLEDVAALLMEHHPEARVWVSLQGFNAERVDYFHAWLEESNPEWFAGLVCGPGSPPIPETRARLDERYALRHYPDITHIVRCQYPIMVLDQVIALTAGREPIMPRPRDFQRIHNELAPYTDGFLSYSDGVHDDVNKIVWSQLGWDPDLDLRQILVEYANVFLGSEDTVRVADGIFAQESNWLGSLWHNGAVESTLALWQELEAKYPERADNWRWQMLLLRAYYDAYQRERLFRETDVEQEANAKLLARTGGTPAAAMEAALHVLQQVDEDPTRPDLRDRCIALFDDLFHSIGLQTHTELHLASGTERGCMLEFMDYPLNKRWWLEDEFETVAALGEADAQWARLTTLAMWEQPAEESYYDNLGHVALSPRVIRDVLEPPRGWGFAWWDDGYSRTPPAWQVFDWPREGLRYAGLDPEGDYLLRFTGFGDMQVFANGQELEPSEYGTEMGEFKKYPVPRELLENGELTVSFEPRRLPGVNWRLQPRLSEAWLIRR